MFGVTWEVYTLGVPEYAANNQVRYPGTRNYSGVYSLGVHRYLPEYAANNQVRYPGTRKYSRVIYSGGTWGYSEVPGSIYFGGNRGTGV